jgi:hypothetical protein
MDRTSGRDFGFSKVEWRDANPDALEAVECEYRRRLDAGARAWGDLDQKARFLFSGLIGLNTVLAGLGVLSFYSDAGAPFLGTYCTNLLYSRERYSLPLYHCCRKDTSLTAALPRIT